MKYAFCSSRLAFFAVLFCLGSWQLGWAEDGYDLWLRYRPMTSPEIQKQYRRQISTVFVAGESPTLRIIRKELVHGLGGLLGQDIPFLESLSAAKASTLIVGTLADVPLLKELGLKTRLRQLGDEGFLIQTTEVREHPCIIITANTERGLLYGSFHFLRLLQAQQNISHLALTSTPKIRDRILNHWDTLSGDVGRGYAGKSLWQWNELPATVSPRLTDYARANASLGINGTVLNSPNSEARILTPEYLRKVAVLADVFRPYGLRVFLSVRFSAPREIGGLETADPLDQRVIAWWETKVREIYQWIPDFGGFLVKANSEGQPGPQDYGRTHADGANMLARALAPHRGRVMWRAFVYGQGLDADRAKRAYEAFAPLDGQFAPNVLVQVKNGPLDFQPREPAHPLFGAMPNTPLLLELQITQEYLGHSQYLVFLAPMWKETLDFDTFAHGPGSTVAKVVEGSLDNHALSGIAGVSNVGSDRNWCGHHFAQANWYAFGRLAWDPGLDAQALAEEWTRQTFSHEPDVVRTIVTLMMDSWEGVVNTMTPLGLNVLCSFRGHYDPAPQARASFHKADAAGLGYDRSRAGSGAVDQYHPPQNERLNNLATCPEKYLLWFHHVAWDQPLQSGRTLWVELCRHYQAGAEQARRQRQVWRRLQGRIDDQRFHEVEARLEIQERDAAAWRDACLTYFQKFSKRPIPVPPAALDE
ncbi:MAG: alpha-glucuronidase [Verrucomicrobia bacterium]|jgi:alpha-glucuronidase|nr:alpha-glucuronidase [Verrucomicrobiota bacterium]